MILEHFMEIAVPYAIHLLEAMGIFVILFTALKAFAQYAVQTFNFTDDTIKIELAKSLALGLEFKLAGEILKTVTIRDLSEVYVLAAIIALRVILTFVIHWEIESDIKHCNEFKNLKESQDPKKTFRLLKGRVNQH
ncbi:protein of unknown function DUF1622 [Alkaliphilus metalliredigens QYMF]|uniref:DUF1622 domain-containing protein n=1 Tax=Alkaliphilus metalliredigens (strain QYMF) TaxID=293826 RepID=A6TMG8_ALKMQ|nr:DUF1622 domain-containing protein [Alkaliphilus metalliredigens]ABR47386.1 protein of unknown function DUF1622 [Alkaliphilus metalliredigens QYMF]